MLGERRSLGGGDIGRRDEADFVEAMRDWGETRPEGVLRREEKRGLAADALEGDNTILLKVGEEGGVFEGFNEEEVVVEVNGGRSAGEEGETREL